MSFVISLFIVLQISSLYLGGTFIDYKFYIHFNIRDILAMKGYFIYQSVLMVLLLIITTVLVYWLSKKIINLKLYKNKYHKYSAIIAFFIVLNINGGIINSLADTIKIITVKDKSFELSLEDLNMIDYIGPEEIVAEKGKNIIIISLESFEKGYFSEKFKNLTPNLRTLIERWNYYEMEESLGGSFTTGSLYMSLTGIPSFWKNSMNGSFHDVNYSYITGISHILEKVGYKQSFLIENYDFGGTKDLVNTYKITNVIDGKEIGSKKDKDLFKKAKEVLLSNKNNKEHFSIFISTMDTHSPDGFYDKRMEEFIEPKKTNLEFMVASVDFMIGDFVNFLEKEGFLENSIVYIYPDHLKMGSGKMFEGTGERGLYFLTNAKDEDISPYIKNNLHQVDLPKIILSGAKIKHNIKFLVDYIGDKNKKDFIDSHIEEILRLNNSSIIVKLKDKK